MTNFPVTHSWLDTWEINIASAETESALTLNSFDFTVWDVSAEGYGMQGNMSVRKQIKAGKTTYWWGYST
jgi:hypothetical protein